MTKKLWFYAALVMLLLAIMCSTKWWGTEWHEPNGGFKESR